MDPIEPLVVMGMSEAGKEVLDRAIQGVSDFLSIVCRPCCEELGLMLKDKVREWRLNNVIKVIEKSQHKLSFEGGELNLRANPRVALSIMDECSIVDDDELQNLWAGLFVSSCTADGKDDSNMNFVDLIRRMSSVEARILRYACEHCQKIIYHNQLVLASDISVPFDLLSSITGTDEIYRLDAEMDHMRSIMLLNHGNAFERGEGFSAGDGDLEADITPSALGLSLYYKTHAFNCSPKEFWGASLITSKEYEAREKAKQENRQ